jgi:hypothetical protein
VKYRVEAGSNTSTVALRVSNLRQQNMIMSPVGLGLENDCAGEDQQQL